MVRIGFWDDEGEWDERAGIREYDGGQSRRQAEQGATRDILARVTRGKDGRDALRETGEVGDTCEPVI